MTHNNTIPLGDMSASPRLPEDGQPTELMRPGESTDSLGHSTVPQQKPLEQQRPMPVAGASTEILFQPPVVLAWLAVKQGPRVGKLYRLAPDVTSIGRDSHNDIIIDDTAVSRQHAKVKLEKDDEGIEQFYVYDLASGNGTVVNGEQVVRQVLYNNDEIEVGRTVLIFKQIEGSKHPDAAESREEEIAKSGG